MNEIEPSLFARIGGSAGVQFLVEEFYASVLADPELAPFFEGVGIDKLRRMQLELFSAALGGPVEYMGRPLVQAHAHLKIGLHDYQRFVRHLFETLSERRFQLTEQERYEVVGRLNLYTDDIVSEGTDLLV